MRNWVGLNLILGVPCLVGRYWPGRIVEHPTSSQPNPGPRPPWSPCTEYQPIFVPFVNCVEAFSADIICSSSPRRDHPEVPPQAVEQEVPQAEGTEQEQELPGFRDWKWIRDDLTLITFCLSEHRLHLLSSERVVCGCKEFAPAVP